MKAPLILASTLALSSMSHAAGINFIYDAGNKLDTAKLTAKLSAMGGTLNSCIEEIAVCQVTFDSVEAAQSSGLALTPDATAFQPSLQGVDFDTKVALSAESASNPPNTGDDDFLFDLQWGHTAINATSAWQDGIRGAGVRVAVLDSGADADHPDLMPNINAGLSMSFVDGEAWDYAGPDTFNHGTHTAGTIAAADNGIGTIGVAPEAELVIMKVLSADTGSGSSYGTMAAMVYAANIDVDIINMSLGLSIRKNGLFDVAGTPYDKSDDIRYEVGGKDGIAQFINTYAKAAKYAEQNGVTLIASAGNESTDLDHTDSLVKLPADLPSVLSISALGPQFWANNPNTDLDLLAIYSNYGQSSIDFAGPGGDFTSAYMPGGFDTCTVAGVSSTCYVFDMIMSTGQGGWYWSAGTSMSAPHAAGVAALIVSENGGSMKPSQLKKAMRDWAEDLGKSGNDDIYGHGRVSSPTY